MDILSQSIVSEESGHLLGREIENPEKGPKRGMTINNRVKEMRVFDEDSEGEVILHKDQPSSSKRDKGDKAENLKHPAGMESDPSQGSLWTMADEVDDQKDQIKEDFDDLHVKIMAITEQIKGLEAQFNQLANAKAVELEGIGKKEEQEMEHHRHLYEIK